MMGAKYIYTISAYTDSWHYVDVLLLLLMYISRNYNEANLNEHVFWVSWERINIGDAHSEHFNPGLVLEVPVFSLQNHKSV